MWTLIYQLALVFAIVVGILLAIAGAYFYLREIRRRRSNRGGLGGSDQCGVRSLPRSLLQDEVVVSFAEAIEKSGLEASQVSRLFVSYLPLLAKHRKAARRSNRRFGLFSKLAVLSPYVAAAIGLATTTILQSHWMWGALFGSLAAGAGKIAKAWDAVEGNAIRRRDAWELVDLMEDALNALLSENLGQPIGDRYQLFCLEADVIRKRELEMVSNFMAATQAAVQAELTAAQASIDEIKKTRRSQQRTQPNDFDASLARPSGTPATRVYRRPAGTGSVLARDDGGNGVRPARRLPVIPERTATPDVSTSRIDGARGLTIAKYIARSQAANTDQKGVIGSEAWPNE